MKVCFISLEYPPYLIGGSGVYAKCLTDELSKLNHEVHVISPYLEEKIDDLTSNNNGVLVHRIPIAKKAFFHSLSFWIKLNGYFKSLEKKVHGFDLIHSNSIGDLSLFACNIKKPRVVTIHHLAATLIDRKDSLLDRLHNLRGELGFTSCFEKTVISRADLIIAVSEFTRSSLLSKFSTSLPQVNVVYNGIYPEQYLIPETEILSTKNLLQISQDDTIFLFVGRVDDKRKNLAELLKTIHVLSHEYNKRVKLLIVGRGDPSEIKLLIRLLNIEKQVLILGYVEDSFLRKIYNSSDVIVSTSVLEGFGLTVLEAMASGKPVIAYGVGAIPELIIDGINGKLVEAGNKSDFLEAMLSFINNPCLIKKIGKNNRKYVFDKFNWKTVALETEKLYGSLL